MVRVRVKGGRDSVSVTARIYGYMAAYTVYTMFKDKFSLCFESHQRDVKDGTGKHSVVTISVVLKGLCTGIV